MANKRQIREAERLAALIAPVPADRWDRVDMLAPPGFLMDPVKVAALNVWKELAPVLNKRVMLDATDRYMLALYCYFQSEFIEADDDLRKRGFAVATPMTNGGEMLRTNPSQKRRDYAIEKMMELSTRFGLTPMDRAKLARAQKDDPAGPLFDPLRRGAPAGDGASDGTADGDDAPGGPRDSWGVLLDDPISGPVN